MNTNGTRVNTNGHKLYEVKYLRGLARDGSTFKFINHGGTCQAIFFPVSCFFGLFLTLFLHFQIKRTFTVPYAANNI